MDPFTVPTTSIFPTVTSVLPFGPKPNLEDGSQQNRQGIPTQGTDSLCLICQTTSSQVYQIGIKIQNHVNDIAMHVEMINLFKVQVGLTRVDQMKCQMCTCDLKRTWHKNNQDRAEMIQTRQKTRNKIINKTGRKSKRPRISILLMVQAC